MKPRFPLHRAAIAATIVSGILPVCAQDTPRTSDPVRSSAPANQAEQASVDLAFYRKALASGAAELDLSRHAVDNAESDDVRTVAQRLVKDHAALNAKLMAASGLDRMPMPPAADKQHADAIKAMSGREYDQAWLEHMAMGHEKSIALYGDASRDAKDERTRTLASAALPDLKAHAAAIESLRDGQEMPAR